MFIINDVAPLLNVNMIVVATTTVFIINDIALLLNVNMIVVASTTTVCSL